jgi:FtsP/CotA-like multicopper oxidase with cupredoxin domain
MSALVIPRRVFLKGAAGAGLVVAGGGLIEAVANHNPADASITHGHGTLAEPNSGGALYTEAFPISPLIGGNGVDANNKAVGSTFVDPLPIPMALAPVPKTVYSGWAKPPRPGTGQQSSLNNERHQKWSSDVTYQGKPLPDPIVYQIKVQVDEHAFTTQNVLPIDALGAPTVSFNPDKTQVAPGVWSLPKSTIYGFNGTFPGPRINAEYGKPALVRFENHLDENPKNLDRGDFGAPDQSFLTHLHNGHTAPESDGNPNYSMNAGPPQQQKPLPEPP